MGNQLVGAQQCGHVHRLRNEAALQDFKGSIHDLHFAGPLALGSGDTDLGTGNQLGGVCLGASHFIQEVGTVFALCIHRNLIVPPRLRCLNIGLYSHLRIHLRRNKVCMAHCLGGGAAGKGQNHGQYQHKCKNLFHIHSPLYVVCRLRHSYIILFLPWKSMSYFLSCPFFFLYHSVAE